MIYVNRCKERSQDNMGHTTDVRAQVFSKTQRDLAYDYGQGNSYQKHGTCLVCTCCIIDEIYSGRVNI